MKFTKEYIKECDCGEIQGLKSILNKFDFYIERDTKSQIIHTISVEKWDMRNKLWLPTGDQLDEEIVKICKKNNYIYSIHWNLSGYYLFQLQLDGENITNQFDFNDINPLIAKIKLLKELLK